ncbi:hypothetical protein K1719_014618 [Acacia pycnantha]|nr:hypothetical protein K1719_014618 [Acacia pycnantha]
MRPNWNSKVRDFIMHISSDPSPHGNIIQSHFRGTFISHQGTSLYRSQYHIICHFAVREGHYENPNHNLVGFSFSFHHFHHHQLSWWIRASRPQASRKQEVFI